MVQVYILSYREDESVNNQLLEYGECDPCQWFRVTCTVIDVVKQNKNQDKFIHSVSVILFFRASTKCMKIEQRFWDKFWQLIVKNTLSDPDLCSSVLLNLSLFLVF
jgi:hypothetical protein